MTQKVITITLRGESADKLRKAADQPKNEHRRIDWTGFSRLIEKEKRA